MRGFVLFVLGLILLVMGSLFAQDTAISQNNQRNKAYILDIKGVIGPATSDYVRRSLKTARENQAKLIVLQIDTPGGLSTAMREIIQDILQAQIPVVSYVTPQGARAASAGTYILYASHVAAMAPGTNLGAATPVQIGGGGRSPFPIPGSPERNDKPKESEDTTTENTKEEKADGDTSASKPKAGIQDKVLNDSIAYIRSLAQLRGRNVEWAEKSVREASSLSSEDALKENVINILADDLKELMIQLDGRKVKVLETTVELETTNLKLIDIKPDWRTNVLSIITNPNIAYILMLVGFYGIIIEFYSPGLIGPGIIGAICLVLAFYAFNVLPVNYAGLALIMLGIAFMIAEAFAPSFGILGLGGAAAFVIGSIMLIDTDVPGYEISWQMVASVGVASTAFFLMTVFMLGRSRRNPVVSGREQMIGSEAEIIDWHGDVGRVRAHGEIWQAKTVDGKKTLSAGMRVQISRIDGLTLIVKA